MIIDELRQYTKQVIFIDDFWIGVRVQRPEFDRPATLVTTLGMQALPLTLR